MHARSGRATLERVHAFRPFALGGVLWVALGAALPSVAAARTEATSIDGLSAPIVRVNLEQANVTIRTWSRAEVKVEGDAGTFVVLHEIRRIPEYLPPAPIAPAVTQGPEGNTITLPAESFVIATVHPGPRDFVEINAPGSDQPAAAFAAFAGPMTVTVPSDSVLVAAHLVNGSIDIDNYHGGTFIATVRAGQVSLDDVGGDGFVQVIRGPLVVTNSNLNRLRARTALGNMLFRRCRSRQIQASSVDGSIVYDAGSFEPGLARFDSARGDVAIGATGASQLNGRVSGGGRIYTLFDRGERVETGSYEAKAQLDGGGPVVNASSTAGNVYLYDGSLRAHGRLSPEWRAPRQILNGRDVPEAGYERFHGYAPARPHARRRPAGFARKPSRQGARARNAVLRGHAPAR